TRCSQLRTRRPSPTSSWRTSSSARRRSIRRSRSPRPIDKITLAEARRLAIHAQLLDRTARPSARSILETTKQIGYLQLDPTNVVARNHFLILWSRLGVYDRADLERLMWNDRSLYETVSFILPTADRPLHHLRVLANRRGIHKYLARRLTGMKKDEPLRRAILGRVRREGPLQ